MYSRMLDSEKGAKISKECTICETHRQIYDLLVTELHGSNPGLLTRVVPLIETAYIMGMKIGGKLVSRKLEELDKIPAKLISKDQRKEIERLRQKRIDLSKQLAELEPLRVHQ